jgi:hypothetical protein
MLVFLTRLNAYSSSIVKKTIWFRQPLGQPGADPKGQPGADPIGLTQISGSAQPKKYSKSLWADRHVSRPPYFFWHILFFIFFSSQFVFYCTTMAQGRSPSSEENRTIWFRLLLKLYICNLNQNHA